MNSAQKSTASLSGLRASLPKTWAVDDRARRYVIPTETLDSLLLSAEIQSGTERQKQVDYARGYLDELGAEAESLSALPPQNFDRARAELQAILAQREFSNHRQPSLWEKVRARIYDLIFRTLDRILSRVGGARSLGNVLLWIAICAAAVFIAYWIFRQWFRRARMEEMALQAAASPARSWQEWAFAARDAASRGDYRTAVHCAYWAGIAHLQALGAIPADRSKTPREYLRTLGRSAGDVPGATLVSDIPARRQALSTLTSLLEKFWYGGQTATDADFRNSLAYLEALGCHLL